ncbi:hypothetical protein D8B45_02060, partial [Candidatus Gracilibacteria bacterium]
SFDLTKQFRFDFGSDVEVSDEEHLDLKEEKIKIGMVFNASCCKELVAFCKLKRRERAWQHKRRSLRLGMVPPLELRVKGCFAPLLFWKLSLTKRLRVILSGTLWKKTTWKPSSDFFDFGKIIRL